MPWVALVLRRTDDGAEAAAGALLLDDAGHAEKVAHLFAGDVEFQRFEGADVDAELTAGADAVLLDDDGLGPLTAREALAQVTLTVGDAFYRADDTAGATVDTKLWIDDVEGVADAGDGVSGAAFGAGRTADARLENLV